MEPLAGEKINMDNLDIIKYPSKHFSNREGSLIQHLIIHAIGYPIEEVFDVLDQKEVSAHFFIPQVTSNVLKNIFPEIFKNIDLKFPDQVPVIELVEIDKKAFHAGPSSFAGSRNITNCERSLNHSSIGIEFHAPGYGNGDGSDWYKFTGFNDAQIDSGIKLVQYLMEKHDINPSNILAHSTISPGRKTDPGPKFPWHKFLPDHYSHSPSLNNIVNEIHCVEIIQQKLQKIGFDDCPLDGKIENTYIYIDAYIMQFAPYLWKGQNNAITIELCNSLK